MKHSGDNRFSSEPEMEVELSAHDLMSLTPSGSSQLLRPLEVVTSSAACDADSVAAPGATVHALTARPSLRMPSLRVIGAAGLVIAALAAVLALFEFAPPQRVVERPKSDWSPRPEPVVEVAEEAPTLMANPFDPSEVFELPAGISKDEARTMVAELLLKRASERRVYSHNR